MRVDLRVHREAEHDRRHDEAHRRAMPFGEREVLDQVEARHDDLRRAKAHRPRHEQVERVDVEVRQHVEEDVVAADRDRGEELLLVRGEVRVREHHALGEAGRAARVRERGEVRHGGLHRHVPRFGGEVVEALDSGRSEGAGDRERADAGEVSADRVDDRRQRFVVQDHGRAGVGDLEAHLALLGERVDRVDDAARLQRAVEGDDELERVRHEEGHAVALRHAPPCQCRREPVGALVELAVGERAVAEHEVGLGADLARDLAETVLQRDLAVRERRRARGGDRHGVPSPPSSARILRVR